MVDLDDPTTQGVLSASAITLIFLFVSLMVSPDIVSDLQNTPEIVVEVLINIFAFIGMVIGVLYYFFADTISRELYALIGFIEWLIVLYVALYMFRKNK